MKYAIIAMLFAFSITDANAVVYCAAGVYHAGCVRRPGSACCRRDAKRGGCRQAALPDREWTAHLLANGST